MRTETDERILEHYRQEAAEHDLSPASTMKDETTREFELRSILDCLGYIAERRPIDRLLEIGCGNGHLLSLIRDRHPDSKLVGMDFSPEMVELARTRDLSGCDIDEGDVRTLTYDDEAFDVVVSERCLINVLDADAQATALGEIARVVRPGGHVVLIEAFTDGLHNLNRARAELGFPSIPMTHHNLWFDKAWFLERIGPAFDVVMAENGDGPLPPTNFLSTHFFMSRVLYPAVTQTELAYNTEFVKFFRFLPPHGDFAPIQLFVLRKKA